MQRIRKFLKALRQKQILRVEIYSQGSKSIFTNHMDLYLSLQSPLAHTFTKEFLSEKTRLIATPNSFSIPMDLSVAESEFVDLSDKIITPGLIYYDPEASALTIARIENLPTPKQGIFIGDLKTKLITLKLEGDYNAIGFELQNQYKERALKAFFIYSLLGLLVSLSARPDLESDESIQTREQLQALLKS